MAPGILSHPFVAFCLWYPYVAAGQAAMGNPAHPALFSTISSAHLIHYRDPARPDSLPRQPALIRLPAPTPLQAMSLMLPRQSPLLQRDTTVEGRLASMSSRGYLAIAKANQELGELLDKVRLPCHCPPPYAACPPAPTHTHPPASV